MWTDIRSQETDNSPDSGSSKEYLVMRTGQMTLLVVGADILHIREHPFFDANLHKGSEDGRIQLNCKNGLGKSG
jgi:predicted ferric reductase